jgi:hypothetical protein
LTKQAGRSDRGVASREGPPYTQTLCSRSRGTPCAGCTHLAS